MTPLAGRSTTWWRVVLAFFVAIALTPISILSVSILPLLLNRSERRVGIDDNATLLDQLFTLATYGMIVVAPFVLVIGGIAWLIAHQTKNNGPVGAGSIGFGTAFIGYGMWTSSMWLPFQSGSSFSANGKDIIINGKLTADGWLQLAAGFLHICLAATAIALIVWCIGYLGRPLKENE